MISNSHTYFQRWATPRVNIAIFCLCWNLIYLWCLLRDRNRFCISSCECFFQEWCHKKETSPAAVLLLTSFFFSFIKPSILFSTSSFVKLVAWTLDIYLKIAELSGLMLQSLICGIASNISKSIELLTLRKHAFTWHYSLIAWYFNSHWNESEQWPKT